MRERPWTYIRDYDEALLPRKLREVFMREMNQESWIFEARQYSKAGGPGFYGLEIEFMRNVITGRMAFI